MLRKGQDFRDWMYRMRNNHYSDYDAMERAVERLKNERKKAEKPGQRKDSRLYKNAT